MRTATCIIIVFSLLTAGCVNSREKITPAGKFVSSEQAAPNTSK
jgi:hypothetical protein